MESERLWKNLAEAGSAEETDALYTLNLAGHSEDEEDPPATLLANLALFI